jgi:chorismate mutase/prephenate dehydratase
VGKPWEYIFFIDVAGHRSEKKICLALNELKGSSNYVKILGSYPIAEKNNQN